MPHDATKRALMLALCFLSAAVKAEDRPRFSVQGSATVSLDHSGLKNDRYAMRGYLQSVDAPSTAPSVQDGGRFTIMASVTAAAQVCYNDTIFRDDFDGDGF